MAGSCRRPVGAGCGSKLGSARRLCAVCGTRAGALHGGGLAEGWLSSAAGAKSVLSGRRMPDVDAGGAVCPWHGVFELGGNLKQKILAGGWGDELYADR